MWIYLWKLYTSWSRILDHCWVTGNPAKAINAWWQQRLYLRQMSIFKTGSQEKLYFIFTRPSNGWCKCKDKLRKQVINRKKLKQNIVDSLEHNVLYLSIIKIKISKKLSVLEVWKVQKKRRDNWFSQVNRQLLWPTTTPPPLFHLSVIQNTKRMGTLS